MSDDFQYIDVDSEDYEDAPRGLRDAYKQLKSRYTETAKERDALKGTLTSTALSDVLGGFKNPDRVKRDLLAEKIDPLDKSAVNEWLAANGDDYARGDGSSTTSPPDADSAEAAAHERFNSGAGLQQPADLSKLDAAIAEAGPNATGAQLAAIYAKHGI